MITLLSANDCIPAHGLDLRNQTYDTKKVNWLKTMFIRYGWDENEPASVGYPLDGKIQLINATHRHEAAKRANIKIPVSIWLKRYIDKYFGMEQWFEINRDVEVRELTSGRYKSKIKGDFPYFVEDINYE